MTDKEYLEQAKYSLNQLTDRLGIDIMVYGDERDENYDSDAYACAHSIAMALGQYEKVIEAFNILTKHFKFELDSNNYAYISMKRRPNSFHTFDLHSAFSRVSDEEAIKLKEVLESK